MGITAQHFVIVLKCDGPRHREPSLLMRAMRLRTETGYHARTKGECVTVARAAGWRIGYRKVKGGGVPDGGGLTKVVVLCPVCAPPKPKPRERGPIIDTERLGTEVSRLAGQPVTVTERAGVLEVSVGDRPDVPMAAGPLTTGEEYREQRPPLVAPSWHNNPAPGQGEHTVSPVMGGEVGLDGYEPTEEPLPADIDPDADAAADAAEGEQRDLIAGLKRDLDRSRGVEQRMGATGVDPAEGGE